MHTATVDPLVGRMLEGRYRIVERIARGGMSTVYGAVDQRLDRRVAVKIMSSALSADPKFTDRFAREARAAAKLTHINAVAVYDQGIDATPHGRDVFLVMELVDGRTLRDLIRERNGRFTPAEAVSIMEPVLSALSAAHRAGLVHRDIKPENILLSDDGLVKVADFGLARAIDADAASTRTGLMMGTVAYCAPEQITQGHCDHRSDVYSAGIVLFELLTGRPPFHGESAMNVAFQHAHSRVPAPSSRARDIPLPIDELVVAATDRDPTGRPHDASVFLAELADARATLALPVVPIPPRRRPSAPPRPPLPQPPPGFAPNLATASARDTQVVSRGRSTPPPTGYPTRTRPVPPRDEAPPVSRGSYPTPAQPKRGRPPISPRARRRRRQLIVLIAFLLLGILSVTGGIVGTRLFREWNTIVPTVSGESAGLATAQLRSTGYAVSPDVTTEFSETVDKGAVIRTDPAAGARLAQGKDIGLVVSLGKQRVVVPNVRGMSVGGAETALRDKGLTVAKTFTLQASTTVRTGDVIETSPAAGAKVKTSQVIVLVRSTGLPSEQIPTFESNTPYAQARAALLAAHFTVARDDEYDDDVPPGDVIDTEQHGVAVYGSPITLLVSRGPQFVTVPSFSALSTSVGDYEEQLSAIGLHADVRALLGGDYGRVVKVDPAPGTQVSPGSTVTVSII